MTTPQSIALTRLFASPHWLTLAVEGGTGLDRFLHELRRTVAPNYRWDFPKRGGARGDPLTERIRFQQQLRDQPALAARHARLEADSAPTLKPIREVTS